MQFYLLCALRTEKFNDQFHEFKSQVSSFTTDWTKLETIHVKWAAFEKSVQFKMNILFWLKLS